MRIVLVLPLVVALTNASCSRCVGDRRDVTLSDGDIAARFIAKLSTFERLRDRIVDEPRCDAVWSDHTQWEEPCRDDPAKTCERWDDAPATAAALVRICDMSTSRAQAYLDDLHALDALRVRRAPRTNPDASDDDVEILLEVWGIVPSGSDASVVYRVHAPAKMHEENETGTHGLRYFALPKDGWYVRRAWN